MTLKLSAVHAMILYNRDQIASRPYELLKNMVNTRSTNSKTNMKFLSYIKYKARSK